MAATLVVDFDNIEAWKARRAAGSSQDTMLPSRWVLGAGGPSCDDNITADSRKGRKFHSEEEATMGQHRAANEHQVVAVNITVGSLL